MADQLDDRGLVEAVGAQADPPPFETLQARARRARRRQRVVTAAASVVAAGVLVGGVALMQDNPRSSPSPVDGPRPHAMTAEQIVTQGHFFRIAANSDGSTLTVWQRCETDSTKCPLAWRVQSASGDVHIHKLPTDAVHVVYSAGDQYVVKEPSKHGLLVDSDGRFSPLQVDTASPLAPGQIAVSGGHSGPMVVDPFTGKIWPVQLPDGEEFIMSPHIDDTGTMWAINPGDAFNDENPIRLLRTRDSYAGWERVGPALPGTQGGHVVVESDHVAVLTGEDGPTANPAVRKLAVSEDRGQSWTVLDGDELPFQEYSWLAATDEGTLFIAGSAGDIWRSSGADWTRFEALRDVPPVRALVSAGSTVVGVSGSANPTLVRIDDDGSFITSPAR